MEAGSRTSLPWVVVGVELVVEVRVVQLSEGRQLHLCLTKLVHLNKKSNTGCPHLREGGRERERERGREGGREGGKEGGVTNHTKDTGSPGHLQCLVGVHGGLPSLPQPLSVGREELPSELQSSVVAALVLGEGGEGEGGGGGGGITQ